jgi:hypothetical protein
MKSVSLSVLNSLLFVRDPSTSGVPEIDGQATVWSTPTCVAISCLPDSEGETEISIGYGDEFGSSRWPLVFDGKLDTPSRTVVVETIHPRTVVEVSVPTRDTRVRVWTNGHPATDKVAIGVD